MGRDRGSRTAGAGADFPRGRDFKGLRGGFLPRGGVDAGAKEDHAIYMTTMC
jgi:hypothetical protein